MFTLEKQATQTGKQIFEGTPLLKVSGTGSSSVFLPYPSIGKEPFHVRYDAVITGTGYGGTEGGGIG